MNLGRVYFLCASSAAEKSKWTTSIAFWLTVAAKSDFQDDDALFLVGLVGSRTDHQDDAQDQDGDVEELGLALPSTDEGQWVEAKSVRTTADKQALVEDSRRAVLLRMTSSMNMWTETPLFVRF